MRKTDVEKINKEVFSIYSNTGPELVVRHIVGITYRTKDNFPDSDIFLVQGKKYASGINPNTFYMSKSSDYISIESRKAKNNNNSNSEFEVWNKFALLKPSFIYMLELMDSITNKFENTNDLFLLKDDGITPSSISDKYKNLAWTVRSFGKLADYISFRPIVLYEKDNNYAGIRITCSQGYIGEISYDQFLYFKLNMKNLIENFYIASLSLYNSALNNILIKMQIENKGG